MRPNRPYHPGRCHPNRRQRSRLAPAAVFVAVLALLLAAPSADAQPRPGWLWGSVAGGAEVALYVPPGVTLPAPTVLFLHGAGSNPRVYQPPLARGAQAAGVVVVAPKSSSDLGWGIGEDGRIVAEALDWAAEQGAADPDRLTAAGHSAGGAYAFLLTYGAGLPAKAVFTLASPFYPLSQPLAARPPIRMYYGKNDPNYFGGSYQRLADQWDRLGVAWESDLVDGYGHNSWPDPSLAAGFAFLAEAAGPPADSGDGACAASDTTLCLLDGRFQVEVEWQDHQGGVGAGQVVPGVGTEAGSSGLFWFFRPDNWELMVKVLDGCSVNQHRWVFSAATTDVAYTLTVTDTETLEVWSHENRAGDPAPAVTDTAAFPCAP